MAKRAKFRQPGDAVSWLLGIMLEAAEEGGLKPAESGRIYSKIMDKIQACPPGAGGISKFGEVVLNVTGAWLKEVRNSDGLVAGWIDENLADKPKRKRPKAA